MYVVLVKFRARTEFAERFRALVYEQAANSLGREAACRRFDVAFDPNNGAAYLLYEVYDDRAAFDAHLQTEHFKVFDAAVRDGIESKEVSCWELADGNPR
ncbi:putative quinol monooxygenase [Botrimarina hoheduenensis]|uniref:Autoinducer-2 (AI-2) modifying protein LsrG n=1 Tax=Botrimarina hoheduenensis TaxID=2528000 RepID=A0A5C5VY87_9BACT|nr:putative quinol monooxygenase [Botrimarina hoheduenensis]TWT43107.1 autoinducer-2 (AI-2) modifying protein LsrG [Botrimarina hoheduenensis]